jgi:UDP-3-O-[3-hydroxymyristoyl] glucosamine N-acyltransferase
MECLKPEAFFDLESFRYRDVFADCSRVWQAIEKLPAYVARLAADGNVEALSCFGAPLPQTVAIWKGRLWREGFEIPGGDVTKGSFRVRLEGEETTEAIVLFAGCVLMDSRILLGRGTVVEPGALIKGPTVIGEYSEVRQGAYIRGKCAIGDRCVVGHTTEMKAGIMLDGAKAGHFAYIGDSILGRLSNLGAGTKLANLKIRGAEVSIRVKGTMLATGMKKLGAVLGDDVEIGCNAVTNPGTLLGKGSVVFPLASVRAGYHEPSSIIR